ncbi:MarR family transcriptional regulator [Marinicauda algicola]|uniref:MarR family transcriptional regulator n=1 Tax=Marinicauda algicola TaxID=2029849 RepID=A0A4S2H614_9PROT|nr:MarR family winged helix-turn-helix transcriptional regulator [Marinicauda algicola]TGY90692.1 MarR family transcriptional regulator [Marinicauda algicola]
MTTHTHIATGLAKIGLFLRSENWRQADAADLSPTQAQILAHLTRRGPARVTALAEALGVTQPTASDAAGALIRKGHVARHPDPDDARASLLHATASGRRAAAETAVWPDALLGAIDTLGADERAIFLKALTKMIRELQVRGAIPVQRMCATCRFFRPNVHGDPAAPHHCAFVDAAFGEASLRLDCDEHEPADTSDADALWQSFLGAPAGQADAPPAATGEAS